jgi:hypothetical protein
LESRNASKSVMSLMQFNLISQELESCIAIIA